MTCNPLMQLVGLRILKSWNLFATRMFYFAAPQKTDADVEEEYRLTLECPWRIEKAREILVGSEDYGLRAEGNTDPAWDDSTEQTGRLQDQKLVELLGIEVQGEIFNTGPYFVVENVRSDEVGGFQIKLSGAYALSVFPTSRYNLEWMLSRRAGGNLSLNNGKIVDTTHLPSFHP